MAGALFGDSLKDVDLDTLRSNGTYYFSNTCANTPTEIGNGVLLVISTLPNRCIQLAFRAADNMIAFRMQWEDFSQEGYPVVWKPWSYLILS